MNIKNLIKGDWEPSIKNIGYNLAKVCVYFYVSGEMTKNMLLKLNDDVTKLYLILSDKIRPLN